MTATIPAPASHASRWRRVSGPALLAGGVMAASVLLHVRDPHRSGAYGYCPWLVLTGTYCPGCGGLRAVNDLTHGDLAAAASSNLLVVGAMPFAVLLWARSMVDRWRGVTRHVTAARAAAPVVAFAVVALLFWVLRNTPQGAWLAP